MRSPELVAGVCALLALPLTEPDPVRWAPLCSGRWAEELGRGLEALGTGLTVPGSLGARPYAAAVSEYRRAFGVGPVGEPGTGGGAPGPVGAGLHPVESVYKPWSTLPGAALPMAREKGWLGGDPAAHLAAVYEAAGVEIPPGWEAVPDHLALELEFLGLLLETAGPEAAALFRRQHLDWLGDLVADAERRGAVVPDGGPAPGGDPAAVAAEHRGTVPAAYVDLFRLIQRFVEAGLPL